MSGLSYEDLTRTGYQIRVGSMGPNHGFYGMSFNEGKAATVMVIRQRYYGVVFNEDHFQS